MLDISAYTFAILDVETTGLSAQFGDRVCEIAIERIHKNKILDSFSTLVNPERDISPGAARVNGLSNEDVRDAPRFEDIAARVETLIGDATIVCHNAPFDLGFLDREFSHLGKTFQAHSVIDTLALARQFFYFPSNSLENIAFDLDIPTPNAHRALGDVITTRRVFQHFLRELGKEGFTHLDELTTSYISNYLDPDDILLPPILEEALTSGERIRIVYADRKGRQTERWITPIQVIATYETIYLQAHCHLRNAERNFRLDRIVDMEADPK